MQSKPLVIAVLLAGSQFVYAATEQTLTTQEAKARYAQDKKLCAEETDSGARMQCLRDAKSEYDKALAAAKAAQPAAQTSKTATAQCQGCGKVVDVQVVEKKGEGSALGLIGGGVAGALLGNQIGAGRGKTLATIAGAAGGAYAGKKVEENVTATNVWQVSVRFDDGEEATYTFEQNPKFAAGDRVKKSGNTVVRR